MKFPPRLTLWRPDPTVLLWLACALAWIGLCIVVFHQIGVLAWRPAALPEIRLLAPRALQSVPAAPELGTGNPFDAAAGRWFAAAPEESRTSAELRGVLLLPGVRAAVTSGGTVHVGEALAGGRLVGIQGGKLQVRQGSAATVEELDVPGWRSPTLQSLNKSAR